MPDFDATTGLARGQEGHENDAALESNRRQVIEQFGFPAEWTVEQVCRALAVKNMIKERGLSVDTTWEAIAELVVLECLVEQLGLPDDAGKPVVQAYLEQRHENLRGADYPVLALAELSQHRRRLDMPEGLDWPATQSWFVFSNSGNIGSTGTFDTLYLELMMYARDYPDRFA